MKRCAMLGICLVLFLSVFPGIGALAKEKSDLTPDARSAILMEQDTGKVLYAKNADKRLPPASMTKIMTMLIIMEALAEDRIKLDDRVRVSEYAASMGGSQIFLEEGEVMSVEDLLKGIAIGSANDASVALAEYIAGSVDAFVKQMNQKAKELGLKNTHFVNVTGLPAENHYSSARDMALIAKALLKYEKVTKYTGMYEDYLREDTAQKFWLVNTNRLVKFYEGVDGLKTGYTNEAKYCLTATAKRNGMRVIAVVMGAPTSKSRNSQVARLLDYAFNQYMAHQLYDRHEKIATVDVDKGVQSKAAAVTADQVSVLTKKGEKPEHIQKEIVINSLIRAPLEKGERVGKLVIKKDGKVLSETDLIVTEDVPRAGFWQLYKRTLLRFSLP